MKTTWPRVRQAWAKCLKPRHYVCSTSLTVVIMMMNGDCLAEVYTCYDTSIPSPGNQNIRGQKMVIYPRFETVYFTREQARN